MAISLKKNRIYTFFFILLFIVSCNNDDIIFTKYNTLEDAAWKSNEKISFSFTVSDTILPKNLFLNIRNNNDYSYSNLHVITSLNFPDGTKIIDTLEYQMANEFGEFLGYGVSNIKENKLFYKESKVFPKKGNYEFTVYHAMRKQGEIKPIPSLRGIQDIGFSIEKQKND